MEEDQGAAASPSGLTDELARRLTIGEKVLPTWQAAGHCWAGPVLANWKACAFSWHSRVVRPVTVELPVRRNVHRFGIGSQCDLRCRPSSLCQQQRLSPPSSSQK